MPSNLPHPAPTFTLRTPTWNDVPALFEMQSDIDASSMAGVKPQPREVFMERWRDILANSAIHTRLIEITTPLAAGEREIVGSVSVFQSEGAHMLGYWIARPHWGKGIASFAVAKFLTLEPRRPLLATAATSNARSHRVLEKCGFRRTGTRMGEETDRYMAREIADFILEAAGHAEPHASGGATG